MVYYLHIICILKNNILEEIVKFKKHVLFIISEKPIEPPPNLDGVQHFICAEVELSPSSDPNREYEISQHYEGVLSKGFGLHNAGTIASWIKNLVSDFGYIPYYRKSSSQIKKDSKPALPITEEVLDATVDEAVQDGLKAVAEGLGKKSSPQTGV
jgi:hypothetical protein